MRQMKQKFVFQKDNQLKDNMSEDPKTNLTDEEVLKILVEAAKKEVVIDESPPIVPIELIKENIRKKGKVWKKDEQKHD